MYRHLRIHLGGLPFPLARFTAEHADVRIIAFAVSRDTGSALPSENTYLVRAPSARHDDIRRAFNDGFSQYSEIDTVEPNLLVFRGRYKPDASEGLRAFLGVLAETIGTILTIDPVTIEAGAIEIPMLTLPRGDSSLRLRALQAYAKERSIDFRLLSERAVPTLPIERPRAEVLDLLEWQVLQALAAAGLYGDNDPPETIVRENLHDLADEFGLLPDEVSSLRRTAERKVVHEYARVRSRNLGLATTPRGDE